MGDTHAESSSSLCFFASLQSLTTKPPCRCIWLLLLYEGTARTLTARTLTTRGAPSVSAAGPCAGGRRRQRRRCVKMHTTKHELTAADQGHTTTPHPTPRAASSSSAAAAANDVLAWLAAAAAAAASAAATAAARAVVCLASSPSSLAVCLRQFARPPVYRMTLIAIPLACSCPSVPTHQAPVPGTNTALTSEAAQRRAAETQQPSGWGNQAIQQVRQMQARVADLVSACVRWSARQKER